MSRMNWDRCRHQVRIGKFRGQMPSIDFDYPTTPGAPKSIHFARQTTQDNKARVFALLQNYIAAFKDRKSSRNFNAAREFAIATAKVLRQCECQGPDFTDHETKLLDAARGLTLRQAV